MNRRTVPACRLLAALVVAWSTACCSQRCSDPAGSAPVAQRMPAPPLLDAGSDPSAPGPAAIVLVVVDTLRADFLPFYGHRPNAAPFLDRLLDDAVIFENAYAPSSWTVPSMASLHTGVYPSSHGVVTGSIQRVKERSVFAQPVLPASFATLAETLRAGGYTTIGVAANQHLGAALGFSQGFDRYSPEARFEDARRLNRSVERHLTDAYGPDWSSSWLKSRTFLWLHYFDPHDPYTPRIPWSRVFAPDYLAHPEGYPAYMTMKRLKTRFEPNAAYKEKAAPLYESEIAFWDDQLNRLAEKARFAADDVLFIFTSDHGEEFGEHGGMGHGNGLHEELVRVPLAIRWPKGFQGPRRVTEPVSLVDLYPTIAALSAIAPPAGLAGKSLAPALRGEPGDVDRPLFMELHPPKPDAKAWRHGRYKLIRTADARTRGGWRFEVYDLKTDPLERQDLAGASPQVVARLAAELESFSKALPAPPKAEIRLIDDEQLLQRLINMDYVKDDSVSPTKP